MKSLLSVTKNIALQIIYLALEQICDLPIINCFAYHLYDVLRGRERVNGVKARKRGMLSKTLETGYLSKSQSKV